MGIAKTLELLLDRDVRTRHSTIGVLYVDGKFECFTLEDVDRNLTDAMTEDAVKQQKIFGQTAIPEGRYKVVLSMSNRFKRLLPEVLGVKGFEGIRIHSGNTDKDTEGCVLVGQTRSIDFVGNSRASFEILFAKMKAAQQAGKEIYLTVQA